MSLTGAAAQLTGATGNYNYDALRELASISPTGSLTVLGGKSFEPSGSFSQNGSLTVDPASRVGLPGGLSRQLDLSAVMPPRTTRPTAREPIPAR